MAYSSLETLQSQQIFALPFSNDNVSKPSWVCPAHLVLIIVPFFFFPGSFLLFDQSRHINSTSLISETDEVQLTIWGRGRRKSAFSFLQNINHVWLLIFCCTIRAPQHGKGGTSETVLTTAGSSCP